MHIPLDFAVWSKFFQFGLVDVTLWDVGGASSLPHGHTKLFQVLTMEEEALEGALGGEENALIFRKWAWKRLAQFNGGKAHWIFHVSVGADGTDIIKMGLRYAPELEEAFHVVMSGQVTLKRIVDQVEEQSAEQAPEIVDMETGRIYLLPSDDDVEERMVALMDRIHTVEDGDERERLVLAFVKTVLLTEARREELVDLLRGWEEDGKLLV